MSKQFSHTTNDRRSSIIYSTSVGKAGLFTPADYIPQESEENLIEDEEDVNEDEAGEQRPIRGGDGAQPEREGEYHSLLDANNSRTLQQEAWQQGYGSNDRKQLLDQERDLLIDNKLLCATVTSEETSKVATTVTALDRMAQTGPRRSNTHGTTPLRAASPSTPPSSGRHR